MLPLIRSASCHFNPMLLAISASVPTLTVRSLHISRPVGGPCRKQAVAKEQSTSSNVEQPLLPDQLELIDTHYFCLNHVKKYDRENYLAALCIKDKLLKRVVFALRAFNVELSLVRDMTTNSDRAKIRFHFWSKLIEEIIDRHNRASVDIDKELAYYKHTPLAKELLDLFYLVDVDQQIASYLKDLVGARVSSKVLGYKPFESLSELELYCLKSNGSIYHLAARVDQQLHNIHVNRLGIMELLDSCAYELGIAHGLSNTIRAIPYNATKNCCYIPKELLEDHGLTNRDFITQKLNGNKVKPVIRELANRCQEHLNALTREMRPVPKHFKQLYLPRVAIQSNLNVLRKCDYNICDSRVGKRNELLPLSLKLSSIYFRAPIL